jgi:crotonobetainyl-CoA:carnitine CoA-transferase CaiB-like acyl-CoA transferase
VDEASIRAARPDIVWASISALGTAHPKVPGYDPVIQAMSGLMSLTGFPDGPPIMHGVQITDLKAGDELYANVLLGLLERAETGRGKRVDVSMLQAAVSWLTTILPNVDITGRPEDVARFGNFHRVFVPTGVYRANDGFHYVAIGNTSQWRSLVAIPAFRDLDRDGRWDTLAARAEEREIVCQAMEAVTAGLSVGALSDMLGAAGIPNAPINTVADLPNLPALQGKLPETVAPDGKRIRLAPMAVDVEGAPHVHPFAPVYGAHTDAVLGEAGLSADEIAALRQAGVVA